MTEKMMEMFKHHLLNSHKSISGKPLQLYEYQLSVAERIFDALIRNYRLTASATEKDIKKLKLHEVPIEFSRQSGKTTAIVHIIEFIMIYFPEMFNRPVRLGIFAPQREQAKTDFDRLKTALMKTQRVIEQVTGQEVADKAKEESNANTLVLANGSSCWIFPVTATSKPESKSLDLMIFEESQDLEDRIVKEQIWPMGATTNAPRIYIGTAGTKLCYFRKVGLTSEALKLYADAISAQRRLMYEQTGDATHLIYEQYVASEVEKHGLESDEVQRPYFGKWLIGTGQFCTEEDIDKIESERGRTHHEKQMWCFVGIDVAKHPDSTVVTVLRHNPDTKKREIVNWLELRGENYKSQYDIIMDFISRYKVQAIAVDSTGIGDFLPDLIADDSQWVDENSGLYRIKFSQSSKSDMYKNLKVVVRELLTTLPKLNTKEGARFREQMLDLQQEYKGQFLTVTHPDDDNAHDDYCDSWALAEWAFALEVANNFADVHIIETSTDVRQDIQKESELFDPVTWGD